MKVSRLCSVLTSLLLALFLLSAAIAVPILCRPFYYAQIDSLELVEKTGWSEEVIREAFDDVMDYLVFGGEFSTGQLKWSEEGMSHFADCRALFRLDFFVVGLSALGLLLLWVVRRVKGISLYRFWGRAPATWTVVGMGLVFLGLALWAVVDFEGLFTVFHSICFPGKTNWIFDWRTDEIILVLPTAFWMRVGGLVLALAFGGGVACAVAGEVLGRKKARRPDTANV